MNISTLIAALGTVSQGILITGPDRRIIYANRAFVSIAGYEEEELLGLTCRFLQGPETSAQEVAQIHTALASGREYAGELINYKKNGVPFWNDLTISPLFDKDGTLSHYIGITRDVSARRSADEDRQRQERLYSFMFEHVQAGIVMHKATTEILYANSMASTLLGVTHDQILGLAHTDPRWGFIGEDGERLPQEAYPVNVAVRTRALVTNLILGLKRTSDSKLVWLMCNASPSLNEHGEPIDVVVSFTDVTELKIAEQALKKSEERLSLVLRGANDAAWDWDLMTDALYYSPRWWQMLGYRDRELEPDSQLWKALTHPDDHASLEATFGRALLDGSASYEVEFRLLHKHGHYVPVLSRGFISRDAAGKAVRVSGTNTDLTDQKLAEQKIYELAFFDPLTHLPNRRLLTELLRKALQNSVRSRQHGALLFIDLDNFKVLNDTLGHDAGDSLLRQVAQRLRETVRLTDSVARLGGDEFLVILEQLGSTPQACAANAKHQALKLRGALGQPYRCGEIDYIASASIGITSFDASSTSVEDILKQADLAMYRAKSDGRNTLRFFDQSMQIAADDRLKLEYDLRTYLRNEQFELYFQPQVDSSGTIDGAEVLLRWFHADRGAISPTVFIPIAELSGIIVPLGEWVLLQACQQLRLWSAHPTTARLTLSVNVSVRQFADADFIANVLGIVKRSGADPSKLRLEVTESLFAVDVDGIIEKIRLLRAAGITFSLDDFGTGYSSLSYLQRMPLDEIKIDRSFVHSLGESASAAAVARTIISLADNLGVEIIAEGVETIAQQTLLESYGCMRYQGYLFGKPVPRAQFEATLISADSCSPQQHGPLSGSQI